MEIYGKPGILETDGERLQCHICGKWRKGLGNHAFKTHGLTADDYREKFGLRYTTALLAPASSAKLSASISRVMDLDRLAANRANADHSADAGRKRRLESKLDPAYQAAQSNALERMLDAFERAKIDGKIPPPKIAQLNTPEAHRKAQCTRKGLMPQISAKISAALKLYHSTHTVKMPPRSAETRQRMSESAKRRGISAETFAKIHAKNKERCSRMTVEERRAMFKGSRSSKAEQ